MNREQSIEFIQAIEDTKALERAILDIIDVCCIIGIHITRHSQHNLGQVCKTALL